MKKLTCIFISFFLLSCNNKNKNVELNLTTTHPITNIREISKTWKNITEIQKEWVKVEKDNNGYLIYEPCDGNTETIKIEKSNVIINFRIESEKYNFKKFEISKENSSFCFDAYKFENKKYFQINARIVDSKNGIVLWEIDGIKWFMTPKENYKSFRIIKNNCETEKKTRIRIFANKCN